MEVAIEELRRSMRQESVLDRTELTTQTYLEAFEKGISEPFEPASLFHENSKYVPGRMGVERRSVSEFDSGSMVLTQALIDQDYAGSEVIDLPSPNFQTASLKEALATRRSVNEFENGRLTIRELATVLGAGGSTATVNVDHEAFDRPRTKPLRAYPSAGALYPVELYVLALDVADLSTGVYYYVPHRHELRVLDRDDSVSERADAAFLGIEAGSSDGASGFLVMTGAFWRSMAKYGPRGYRYILQESGHLSQNLLLAAAAIDVAALPVGGFYDDDVDGILGVDGIHEATVYGLALGPSPGAEDA